MCLAKIMLGENYKEGVLEMNASDDRGIDVVRNKIKMFAQKKVSLPPGKHKIVILDEADSMTQPAQQAMRRTMEIYANTTRFALACNLSTKIIEPIQSRCAILRFSRLNDEEIMTRLISICKTMDIPYTPEGIESILYTSDGDLRQAINNLQSTYSGFGNIIPNNVMKVCDQPHPFVLEKVLKHCINKDIKNACDDITLLYKEGYSCNDIISSFFKVTRNSKDLTEDLKLLFIKEIGHIHMRIIEGVSSLLQLYGLCSRLCNIELKS